MKEFIIEHQQPQQSQSEDTQQQPHQQHINSSSDYRLSSWINPIGGRMIHVLLCCFDIILQTRARRSM